MQTTDTNYGRVLREARLAKGWTRADLAEVYGRFFHDESISEDTIRMWEDYNKVPKAQKRRQALAFLLDIPITALGLEPLIAFTTRVLREPVLKGIDVTSATAKLQVYKMQNHASTAGPLLTDILGTIHSIHDEIPYVTSKKRTQFLLLLCDYQQFVASLYRDQSQYSAALYYQNKAYAVAKTLQDPEQLALILWRRGITYDCQGNFQAAISDFLAAQHYEARTAHLKGTIWASLGHAQAQYATSQTEQKVAFLSFDKAAQLLDKTKGEPDDYFIKFNAEGFHLNRAAAWVTATKKELRSPSHAFDGLTCVPIDEQRKRRYTYSTYIQARSWFEDGQYPIATQIARDALAVATEINSQVNIQHITRLYEELKATNFGKSPEVAELGLEIIRAQNREMFA